MNGAQHDKHYNYTFAIVVKNFDQLITLKYTALGLIPLIKQYVCPKERISLRSDIEPVHTDGVFVVERPAAVRF